MTSAETAEYRIRRQSVEPNDATGFCVNVFTRPRPAAEVGAGVPDDQDGYVAYGYVAVPVTLEATLGLPDTWRRFPKSWERKTAWRGYRYIRRRG